MRARLTRRLAWLPLLLLGVAAVAQPPLEDSAFLDQGREAMQRMMTDMNVRPSGDVDRDFAAMMIPHHQGAIDMAVAELRFGHDPRLRRIAQEIIVDQQQEIVAMQAALADRPPSAPSQGQPGSPGPDSQKMVMP